MTWRAPDPEDRQVAALWAFCAGLALLLRPLWLAGATLVPACPWRVWAGWPCPGCGTTRAVVQLLHADVTGAFSFNPLSACGAITFCVGGLAAPAWLACGGRAPCFATRLRSRSIGLLAAALLANWAWLVTAGV